MQITETERRLYDVSYRLYDVSYRLGQALGYLQLLLGDFGPASVSERAQVRAFLAGEAGLMAEIKPQDGDSYDDAVAENDEGGEG